MKLQFIPAVALIGIVLLSVFSGNALAAAEETSQSPVAGGNLLGDAFPSSGTLDDFNRANGTIGGNWGGPTGSYSISSGRLYIGSGQDIYWKNELFGLDQEAFVSLSTIDATASELGLFLKSQSGTGTVKSMINVFYAPAGNNVQVWTAYNGAWTKQGANIPVVFANGDQLGARAYSNGDVEVYKNGTLLGVQNVSSWPFHASTGYAGIYNYQAGSSVMDDFGGGTMPSSPTLTPTPFICTDPLSCNPVVSVPAYWRCNSQDCTGSDWRGTVINWPSWAAYDSNGRTGNNSRTVYAEAQGTQKLYPYMGSWANGCRITAVSGVVLIIEWQRGTDIWRETYLNPGETHTIQLVYPENGVMLESPNDLSIFSVSFSNCTPQNIYITPTPNATGSPTATATHTATPTATGSPTATATLTRTPTATFSPTATPTYTPTATNSPTATSTFTSTPTTTSSPTATSTYTPTPTATNSPTATSTYTSTPTATHTLTSTATSSPTATSTHTETPTATSSPTATSTQTLTPTATNSPTATPTHTQTSTATSSPTATSTQTLPPPATSSPTATSTSTPTSTATGTPTAAATYTPTPTATSLSTDTPTFTPTATVTSSPTATPTHTLTPTASNTPTVTATQHEGYGVEIAVGDKPAHEYALASGHVLVKSYASLQNGPVKVSSPFDYQLFTSQRVISGTSFNEVMGYPANQLTTEYWFPWYDNKSMSTWILVGNASSTQTAAVDIYIGGIKRGSYNIPIGSRITPRFNIEPTGPVRVVSTNGVKIFSSERALYKDAFNEVMGVPTNQLATEYWFPWYDNKSMATWLLVGNPSTTSTAAVDIYIGGKKVGSYVIPKGGRVTPRFNLQAGPVRVVSTNGVRIFSSERTLYGESFNEVMGYPGNQLTTEYWYPWYDNIKMSTWLLVGNPTTSTAKVDIYVGTTKTSYSIAANGRIMQRFNLNVGPVRVVSTNGIKIFTSERVLYGASFNEVMGYPGNQLTTEYWFPWYDSTSMSTDILVGRP